MNNINLFEWERWFLKYIKPVFTDKEINEYYEFIKKIQTPFYPKNWVAKKFYEKIKNDNRFDEELKLFFSFLYSCGFFMENIITFEEWLTMKNWINPNNKKIEDKTILEILNEPNGINFLKSKFRWLPFLNRIDGQ